MISGTPIDRPYIGTPAEGFFSRIFRSPREYSNSSRLCSLIKRRSCSICWTSGLAMEELSDDFEGCFRFMPVKRKQPSKSSESSSIASPEVQQIEQLLRFMSEHNLEEFEYSRGDLRIRLKKPSAGVPMYGRSMGVPEIIVPGATERQAPASQSAPPPP